MAGISTVSLVPDDVSARPATARMRALLRAGDVLLPRQRSAPRLLPVTPMAEALAIGLGCDRRGARSAD